MEYENLSFEHLAELANIPEPCKPTPKTEEEREAETNELVERLHEMAKSAK